MLGRPVKLVEFDIEEQLPETVAAAKTYLIDKEKVDVVVEGFAIEQNGDINTIANASRAAYKLRELHERLRLLKGGAPGLHFYAMNQAALTTEICRRLG